MLQIDMLGDVDKAYVSFMQLRTQKDIHSFMIIDNVLKHTPHSKKKHKPQNLKLTSIKSYDIIDQSAHVIQTVELR